MCRFLIMVNEPAFIDTFPVLRMEFPFRVGFHRCMVFLPADKAFHKSGLLIYQFCGGFFPGHILLVQAYWQKKVLIGEHRTDL